MVENWSCCICRAEQIYKASLKQKALSTQEPNELENRPQRPSYLQPPLSERHNDGVNDTARMQAISSTHTSPPVCLNSPLPISCIMYHHSKKVSPRRLHHNENSAKGSNHCCQKESFKRNFNKISPPRMNMSKIYDINELTRKQLCERLQKKSFVGLFIPQVKRARKQSPVVANHKVFMMWIA